MLSCQDLGTDTDPDDGICLLHNKDVIKVCLQDGCDQLKLCRQCLDNHNPSHKEINSYQLFRDAQQHLQKESKLQKSPQKFDGVFKQLQEMRQIVNVLFNQLESDIKEHLLEKINIDDLNNKYQSLIKINETNYMSHLDKLKVYYDNPNMFSDGQTKLSLLEDTVLCQLNKVCEKLRLQIENLKKSADQLFEIKSRKASEQHREDQLQLIQTINGHENVVRCIIKLHNGDYATSSRDKTIKIWNSQTYQCIQILKDHINWVQDLTLLPGGKFASCSDDKTIKIFSQFQQSNSWECVNTLRGHESYVVRIVYNDLFKCLITCSTDGTLRLWDVSQKHSIKVLQGHDNCIYTLASTDSLIVSGDEGGQLIQWSLNHNKIENKKKGHSGCVNCILIKQYIYSCGDDHKFNVWTRELQFIYVINFQRSELESMQFINEELIVGGDEQGYLLFINPQLGSIVMEVPIHNDRIYKINYYDGILCTCSSDLSAKIYNLM